MSIGTKEVLIVGGVGLGAWLLMRSNIGNAIGFGLQPSTGILGKARAAVSDVKGIVNDANSIFGTAKDIWGGFSGFFDSVNETPKKPLGGNTNQGTSLINTISGWFA